MRYKMILEQRVDTWDDGYGVVQIVTPEGTDRNELQFCYYKDGDFVNRPLTVAPTAEVADRTAEVVETMASLARTFTADEISALVDELGKSRLKDILDETEQNRTASSLPASARTNDMVVDSFRGLERWRSRFRMSYSVFLTPEAAIIPPLLPEGTGSP